MNLRTKTIHKLDTEFKMEFEFGRNNSLCLWVKLFFIWTLLEAIGVMHNEASFLH